MVVFQAFKFYMEQHVENIMKTSEDRRRRRQQLEKEMMRCDAKELILGTIQGKSCDLGTKGRGGLTQS